MNEGLGKDFNRKGNSVKRSGPFCEPPDSAEKLLSSSPPRRSALSRTVRERELALGSQFEIPDHITLAQHATWALISMKIILTAPNPPYLPKICPQNMPYDGGPYGTKVG